MKVVVRHYVTWRPGDNQQWKSGSLYCMEHYRCVVDFLAQFFNFGGLKCGPIWIDWVVLFTASSLSLITSQGSIISFRQVWCLKKFERCLYTTLTAQTCQHYEGHVDLQYTFRFHGLCAERKEGLSTTHSLLNCGLEGAAVLWELRSYQTLLQTSVPGPYH